MFNANAIGVDALMCMWPVIPELLTMDFLLSRDDFQSAVWQHDLSVARFSVFRI